MRIHMQMPGVGGLLVPEFIFDELRGSSIKVTVPERGRIERIEQLRQITHVNTHARRAATRVSCAEAGLPTVYELSHETPGAPSSGGEKRVQTSITARSWIVES